jgi:SAM-dependent methyltransferase
MSHKEYYYNEAVTRFYDPVYDRMKSLQPGLEFYLNEIKNTKGPILEAGAGTGRIFIPALDGRADIYGIDYSEGMLARLKEKISPENHSRIMRGDIRDFSFDKKFKLIISPFRVFQHLVTINDQLKALNSLYQHLEDGGRLIFDVFNPDLNRIGKDVEDVLEFDGEYEPGKKLKRLTSIKFNHINQLMDLTFKFVWDENGSEHTDSFSTPLRYYFRFEIENLIARTKFKLQNIYGDFKRSELSNKSSEFVVVCSK